MVRQSTRTRIRWLPLTDTALHTTVGSTTRRSVRGGILRIVQSFVLTLRHMFQTFFQLPFFFIQSPDFFKGSAKLYGQLGVFAF